MQENMMGPKHCGLIGRRAGTVPGYVYSQVMRDSGIVWSGKTLDAFLKSPLSHLPGTNMGYAGLYDEQDRAHLIAFLQKATTDPGRCSAGPDPAQK